MTDLVHADEYWQWIISIKQRIQISQLKAAVSVHRIASYFGALLVFTFAMMNARSLVAFESAKAEDI